MRRCPRCYGARYIPTQATTVSVECGLCAGLGVLMPWHPWYFMALRY